ncbi:MAG TPA: cation diffusion facilitator family transporter [Dehalococcoidia bacterium]|nr:cation diffusion facilitator family transporter [Dehalococcoidia bacterium]
MAHNRGSAGFQHKGRLLTVFALTAAFMVVEATVGFLAGSLVLIADAGHMLTDVAGLGMALGSIWLAQRRPSDRKTYGYYRAEILAALFNAVLLIAVAGYILYEAFARLTDPPDVSAVPLIVVASGGLAVNLIGLALLHAGSKESLNVRGAFLEVWKDVLGSIAAVAAGVIILTTGWTYADPILAAAVGLLILPRSWDLMKKTLEVLLEGTPEHIDLEELEKSMVAVPGVLAIHDLHVWTVTSGFVALSAHAETGERHDQHDTLVGLRRLLAERFGIDHATLQIETRALHEELESCCGIDSRNTSPAHAAHHR